MERKKTSLKEQFRKIKESFLDKHIRQRVFISVESMVTLIIAIAATILNFSYGYKIIGYITLTFALIMLLFVIAETFIFVKKLKVDNRLLMYINFGLTDILVILYLIFAPKNGLFFYWIVSVPILFCIVGGTRRGIIHSIGLLIVVTLFFYCPPFTSWMTGPETDTQHDYDIFRVFFILNYIMTTLIGFVVAFINVSIINRLNYLKEKYFEDANTDITTGLRNQLYFLNYVKHLSEILHPGDRVGLMFIDIDDFKLYNDKYGHTVGNQVLISVANKLAEVKHDLLCRWGGDEFAIIERNISKEEFVAKANLLLTGVAGLENEVTISIGLAHYIIDENFDFNVLFNDADMAAIRAKGKGKNCIIIKEN